MKKKLDIALGMPCAGQLRVRGEHLLETAAHPCNLENACRRVKSNKGAPVMVGMTEEEPERWLNIHMAATARLVQPAFVQVHKTGSAYVEQVCQVGT